jgi:transposase
LKRDPHAGELFCFRGKRGSLMKVLWHDGVGMSLYMKRLDHGRFISYGLCQRFRPQMSARPKRAAILEWHDPHR